MKTTLDKACPIVVRSKSCLEILAFKHPLAGLQLVKGTIEPNESLSTACERELLEESGMEAKAKQYLGECRIPQSGVWGFYEMQTDIILADSWTHYTQDGGGLLFEFFWHPLLQVSGEAWHSQYCVAAEHIQSVVAT